MGSRDGEELVKRMGTSEVLWSENSFDCRKPSETTPKSIPSRGTAPFAPPSEKWKLGPTTRPFTCSGSGCGCPCSVHRNVSENSPSRWEQNSTSI